MTPRLDRYGDRIEDDEQPEILAQLFGKRPWPELDPLRCSLCPDGVPDIGRGICPECDQRTRRPQPRVESSPTADDEAYEP